MAGAAQQTLRGYHTATVWPCCGSPVQPRPYPVCCTAGGCTFSPGSNSAPLNFRNEADIERTGRCVRTSSVDAMIAPSKANGCPPKGDHQNGGEPQAAYHLCLAVHHARWWPDLPHGPDFSDQYRRAASYVYCILKGEKPGRSTGAHDPTKYQLAINLKKEVA